MHAQVSCDMPSRRDKISNSWKYQRVLNNTNTRTVIVHVVIVVATAAEMTHLRHIPRPRRSVWKRGQTFFSRRTSDSACSLLFNLLYIIHLPAVISVITEKQIVIFYKCLKSGELKYTGLLLNSSLKKLGLASAVCADTLPTTTTALWWVQNCHSGVTFFYEPCL